MHERNPFKSKFNYFPDQSVPIKVLIKQLPLVDLEYDFGTLL